MIADPDRGTRGVLGLANGPDMYEAPPGGHKDHQRGETAPLGVGARKQVFVAALAIVTAEGA